MDETQIIRQPGEIWQHIGNHFARLSSRAEFPQWLDEISVLALKRDELVLAGQRLVVSFNELGLVIPRVDMAERARTKDDENVFGFRREVRRARCERMLGRPLWSERL